MYAEDFSIGYDNKLFDYVGFEEVSGFKVYNKPADQNGILRFIVASQGKDYGINDEKTFLKLKLRAKAVGTGKVDALKCRIADTEKEFDLEGAACLEDSIVVEGVKDVNRSGEYTLLDLAIDGYYYSQLASVADPSKYDANQAGDEYVKDEDLIYIVNQMLLNSSYLPNK
ncbi:cohesin domain-containing protein [Paenibacillus elgii]|uniref:cohesin domain-containing protein n=1 Tax=Paenibacillus elgii TaxID=189691 RepID=UPI003527000A